MTMSRAHATKFLLFGSAVLLVSMFSTLKGWSQSVAEPTVQAVELNKRGEELLTKKSYADAAKQFRKAIALDPNYEIALRNLGTAQEALGKDDLALPNLQKAIKIAPDDAIAQNGLGHAFFHEGKYQDAAGAYRKAVAIHTNYPRRTTDLVPPC